jgi:hypothetical protein
VPRHSILLASPDSPVLSGFDQAGGYSNLPGRLPVAIRPPAVAPVRLQLLLQQISSKMFAPSSRPTATTASPNRFRSSRFLVLVRPNASLQFNFGNFSVASLACRHSRLCAPPLRVTA